MASNDVPDDRPTDLPDEGVSRDLPDDIRVFRAGDQVRLEDPKGRHHLVTLEPGRTFHTHRGGLALDELIGKPEGVVVTSSGGVPYLALRPLWSDYVLAMPRGATIVYPKDAGQILIGADIFPGAHVIEAGAGSGSLTCVLLRAVGPTGRVTSYERREDFAAIARRNVERFFGESPSTWHLVVGDVADAPTRPRADRIVLDLLAPWDCLPWVAETLRPGGVLCCYVATTTQLGRLVETVRAHGGFTEPLSSETLWRTWHVEGLSIRPDHRMVGHTGFLMTTRRLAPGVTAPRRRRRPAPGAYGEDYTGPRPAEPTPTSQNLASHTSAPRPDAAEDELASHEGVSPDASPGRADPDRPDPDAADPGAAGPEKAAPEND
jgi:tRNA (adenine57-N1/adenine58-N1)-methyltransferase